QIGPLCQNSTAPALPATSNNGFTGTWSPAVINTATVGTTTYTFTPTDPCAAVTTMNIVISAQVTPTFTAVAPICSGATLNPLPTTSNNGITGTWSPALDNTVTTTYTFTPTTGQCATTTTLTIVVNPNITPDFGAIGPLCQGSNPPVLAATSPNGITGVWNPAIISTAAAGVTTYTFSPTTGQCANPQILSITVTAQVVPTFTQIGPLCQNSTAPALPATSNNGFTGTWSPSTISTATVGTTTYTFTPTDPCAAIATMDIVVTTQITPTFSAVAPICSGATLAALPTTSHNGSTGTWSPALNNAPPTTYTFPPTAGQCATTTTLTITVNPQATPTFSQIGPLCQNSTAPTLPSTSGNGFTGTWSPSTISTATVGTTTYTFAPTGPCAAVTTMDIV